MTETDRETLLRVAEYMERRQIPPVGLPDKFAAELRALASRTPEGTELPAGPDLAAEVERLRSIIEGASDKSPAGYDWSVLGKIDELERENERLRTALAFYVDPDNHVLVNYDRGDIARTALEGTK